MAAPTDLPINDRTPINTVQQITLANSPVHLRLQNDFLDNTIRSAVVYLWMWNGDQDAVLGSPNIIITKSQISASDIYINVEISSYIKSFLINPNNQPNSNNPTFRYNRASNPSINGQGTFWQIVTDITSVAGTVRYNYNTAFATLGWRWNYEQNFNINDGDNDLFPYGASGYLRNVNRWYNSKIHNYISQSFNLNNSVADANSENMILVSDITPPADWIRCVKDSYFIVFINKLGLWDMFSPLGKCTISNQVKSDTTARAYRDPSQVDNSFNHSRLRDNIESKQAYVINTGLLDDTMSDIVEEIIYSPKVYLINFKGDIQTSLTIDSTLITIDSTLITIDAGLTTGSNAGKFKTHRQIPVTLTDEDFTRKNSVNNKVAIDYNLKFEETNNKILNIR